MQVIVRDRREGKTTELIQWLLRGHIQEGYPQWSRVIVAPTKSMVISTTRMITEAIHDITDPHWLCERSQPHMDCEGPGDSAHLHTAAQIRKAVWSLRELNFNARGVQKFEYALDDGDYLLAGGMIDGLYKRPDVLVITGEHVEHLRD